ncbi:hypothetical protein KCP76_26105 (plasmid) [Salmonella enterica subsp. enterica serovar Weltevreden]|nr:hypothetical protein KCP76_26105 [Salmonella enterica subsp. enterica serovar Weltevreden]QUI99509.1 hypothetical protein KCP74_25530 [Salmonella enterica subsp. enterica]QUJ01279.1 hypothetical protein KCP73_26845 [Salmonella enterica subsp. enterica]
MKQPFFTVQAYHHPALRVLLCEAQRRLCIISNSHTVTLHGWPAGRRTAHPPPRSRDSSLTPRAFRHPRCGFQSTAPRPLSVTESEPAETTIG